MTARHRLPALFPAIGSAVRPGLGGDRGQAMVRGLALPPAASAMASRAANPDQPQTVMRSADAAVTDSQKPAATGNPLCRRLGRPDAAVAGLASGGHCSSSDAIISGANEIARGQTGSQRAPAHGDAAPPPDAGMPLAGTIGRPGHGVPGPAARAGGGRGGQGWRAGAAWRRWPSLPLTYARVGFAGLSPAGWCP
jgi:hypothetical protein